LRLVDVEGVEKMWVDSSSLKDAAGKQTTLDAISHISMQEIMKRRAVGNSYFMKLGHRLMIQGQPFPGSISKLANSHRET